MSESAFPESGGQALTHGPRWKKLAAHARDTARWHLRDLFAADARRASTLSLDAAGLHADYSKHRITRETIDLLCALAREREVETMIGRMYAGEPINTTERRAVLHVALRDPDGPPLVVEGTDIRPGVRAVLAAMEAYATGVREGLLCGVTGAPFRHVINIGIGGSDLGPALAVDALVAQRAPELEFRFVSNVDGAHLTAALTGIDPARTLFIVCSKTFTTLETLANASAARDWLSSMLGAEAVGRHFVAVSANAAAALRFGIPESRVFGFWDWVGGRYSLWSAVGLSVMLAIGPAGFRALLAGAHEMDRHFASAPLERNLPALLALIDLWYQNFLDAGNRAILPYDQRLARLPAYLQQLVMESNGKRVQHDGTPVACHTAPLIWGEPGTNGQHAFFQLLHQGTRLVPCDFIVARECDHPYPDLHRELVANCLAQSEALAFGMTAEEARARMHAEGLAPAEVDRLAAHRTFPGNQPSTTLVLPRLEARSFGALLALYEHQVLVQGAIWGINPFDQYGVELGKRLAKTIAGELRGAPPASHDASTAALIGRLRL
jgi:glucose-6-phosphate isomerase